MCLLVLILLYVSVSIYTRTQTCPTCRVDIPSSLPVQRWEAYVSFITKKKTNLRAESVCHAQDHKIRRNGCDIPCSSNSSTYLLSSYSLLFFTIGLVMYVEVSNAHEYRKIKWMLHLPVVRVIPGLMPTNLHNQAIMIHPNRWCGRLYIYILLLPSMLIFSPKFPLF